MSLQSDLKSLSPEARERVAEALKMRRMLGNLGLQARSDILETVEATMTAKRRYPDPSHRNTRVKVFKGEVRE